MIAINCGAENTKIGKDKIIYSADQNFSQNSKIADYFLNDLLKDLKIRVNNI